MSTLTALLVQARLRWREPERNREHLQKLLDAEGGDADLAVLPETFTTGFLGDGDLPDEGMDGPTVAWMRDWAHTRDCALAGSAVIVEDGQRYNRLLFVTPDGDVTHYDKRHLFAYGGENRRYAAGNRRVNVEYRGWRINLQVCYDLRFPAWCRYRGDYDLMLLVANWPSKRAGHWSTLLEARAIENQSWVIGVNRVGEDGNGFQYPGRSVVHDPLGARAADLGDNEGCRRVELELETVRRVRAEFPFHADADRFTLD
ncbi:MAG: amidohydrolase [Xanthomonadales bacterium]|nr:amidohydrolase [Xanthomonadales bacterium]